MATEYTFEELSKKGDKAAGDKEGIGLTGVLTGALIDSMGPPGIQMSLMPEPEPFDTNPDSRVIVFLPGQFDPAYLQTLMLAKHVGSRIHVEGPYEHQPNGNYLGKLTARAIEERP